MDEIREQVLQGIVLDIIGLGGEIPPAARAELADDAIATVDDVRKSESANGGRRFVLQLVERRVPVQGAIGHTRTPIAN